MINKKMLSMILGLGSLISLSLIAMEQKTPISHKFMTVDEFAKQVEDDKKASLRALKDENAYAEALWDADAERVKFFLDRHSKADQFRKINQPEQYIGKGAIYVEKTPLEIVSFSRADKPDKWAVYELLLKYGADADKHWRNQQLLWTKFDHDEEFAQWLRAHGAQ